MCNSGGLSRHWRDRSLADNLLGLLLDVQSSPSNLDDLWAGPGRLVFSAGTFLGLITCEAHEMFCIVTARHADDIEKLPEHEDGFGAR
jgi:hypothetical protein